MVILGMPICILAFIPLSKYIWQPVDREESQSILLVVLILLTVTPTVFNIWNFHVPEVLIHPSITGNNDKLIQD